MPAWIPSPKPSTHVDGRNVSTDRRSQAIRASSPTRSIRSLNSNIASSHEQRTDSSLSASSGASTIKAGPTSRSSSASMASVAEPEGMKRPRSALATTEIEDVQRRGASWVHRKSQEASLSGENPRFMSESQASSTPAHFQDGQGATPTSEGDQNVPMSNSEHVPAMPTESAPVTLSTSQQSSSKHSVSNATPSKRAAWFGWSSSQNGDAKGSPKPSETEQCQTTSDSSGGEAAGVPSKDEALPSQSSAAGVALLQDPSTASKAEGSAPALSKESSNGEVVSHVSSSPRRTWLGFHVGASSAVPPPSSTPIPDLPASGSNHISEPTPAGPIPGSPAAPQGEAATKPSESERLSHSSVSAENSLLTSSLRRIWSRPELTSPGKKQQPAEPPAVSTPAEPPAASTDVSSDIDAAQPTTSLSGSAMVSSTAESRPASTRSLPTVSSPTVSQSPDTAKETQVTQRRRSWLPWGSSGTSAPVHPSPLASGVTYAGSNDGAAGSDAGNEVHEENHPESMEVEVPHTKDPPLPSSKSLISGYHYLPSPAWLNPWSSWTATPQSPARKDGKTESEAIRDEARARDFEKEAADGTQTADAPSSPPAAQSMMRKVTSGSEYNPILASKSSWSSLFALRNAFPSKAVSDKPSGEMEVMDLDLDEAQNATQATQEDASKALTKIPSGQKSSITNSTPTGARTPTKGSSIHPGGNGTKFPPGVSSGGQGIEPPSKNPAQPLTSSDKKKKHWEPGKPPPNLILPSFHDIFCELPRSVPPPPSMLQRTLTAFSSYILSQPPSATFIAADEAAVARAKLRAARSSKGKGKEENRDIDEGMDKLPRTLEVMGEKKEKSIMNVGRVVVIGIHGWFAKSMVAKLLGEPTGTSVKFAHEMKRAVHRYFADSSLELNPEAITAIPLEGEGKIEERVDRLYAELLSRKEWVDAIGQADALFIATHSQGAIVSTHLLARLLEQNHIPSSTRICLLAMAGIHHGPFASLTTNLLPSTYLQYFENSAAQQLFDFQTSASKESKRYEASMRIVLDRGVKVALVASLDDQVVPVYSGTFTGANHPSILRALYIDGEAFASTDFLTNLMVFCLRLRNASLDDHNLLMLLSESVAGSLTGMGHSKIYDEQETYMLAVRYLFETTHPLSAPTTPNGDESKKPVFWCEPFEVQPWNPYNLPWALRGVFELDDAVQELFANEIEKLRLDYERWDPKTKALKDVKYRLEPLRGVHGRWKKARRFPGAEDDADAEGGGPGSPGHAKL